MRLIVWLISVISAEMCTAWWDIAACFQGIRLASTTHSSVWTAVLNWNMKSLIDNTDCGQIQVKNFFKASWSSCNSFFRPSQRRFCLSCRWGAYLNFPGFHKWHIVCQRGNVCGSKGDKWISWPWMAHNWPISEGGVERGGLPDPLMNRTLVL